jgi:hypothetical protein
MIVLASAQTISRTDGDAVLEMSRTFFPSRVDSQRPRPGFPGSFQEKAKCLLFGAHTGGVGVVPVNFGVANKSSRESSLSCAVAVMFVNISRPIIKPICQKEIFFMCLN